MPKVVWKRFLKNHELSLWLLGVWFIMLVPSLVFRSNFLSDHASAVFGALVVVFTQKILKLHERD
jgi:hypothetical protein